jgi:hypothetical protein
MPPDPQHGSKTTPFSGSSIATSVLTIETGVKYSPPRFSFARGELTNEILVDAADQVVAAVVRLEDVLAE